MLQQGLDLWRGPAFGEFAADSWAVAEAARLDGLRIVARERWCEAVLRAGDANEAVMTAEALTREHPLREEGWRLLAMGLYAEGRQADALTALRRARDILADELGMDPGRRCCRSRRTCWRSDWRCPQRDHPAFGSAARSSVARPPAADAAPAGRGRPNGDPDRDVARIGRAGRGAFGLRRQGERAEHLAFVGRRGGRPIRSAGRADRR